LADYREHEGAIRAAGAKVAAISADSAEKAQAVRDELHLGFPILCDTHRRVIREWGVYNAREKGGIAKPAVFIIDPGRAVRYVSVDNVASRIPASEIARLLREAAPGPLPKRHTVVPHPGNFFRAVSNSLHYGVRQPESKSE
jgi:peroxiredoxin